MPMTSNLPTLQNSIPADSEATTTYEYVSAVYAALLACNARVDSAAADSVLTVEQNTKCTPRWGHDLRVAKAGSTTRQIATKQTLSYNFDALMLHTLAYALLEAHLGLAGENAAQSAQDANRDLPRNSSRKR